MAKQRCAKIPILSQAIQVFNCPESQIINHSSSCDLSQQEIMIVMLNDFVVQYVRMRFKTRPAKLNYSKSEIRNKDFVSCVSGLTFNNLIMFMVTLTAKHIFCFTTKGIWSQESQSKIFYLILRMTFDGGAAVPPGSANVLKWFVFWLELFKKLK